MGLPASASFLELLRVPRRPIEEILLLQRHRLLDLISHAQARSPFYRTLYRDLPWTESSLTRLPPVTKEALNSNLHDVLTDPAIGVEQLATFLGERQEVGKRFIGRYVALRTSGTTGRMGTMIYDPETWMLFKTLSGLRGIFGGSQGPSGLPGVLRFLGRRHRIAYLVAGGGHFSTAALALHRPLWARIWCREAIFPIDSDFRASFQQLHEFRPEVIHVYPSFAEDLADAQESGMIRLDPLAISTSSEPLPDHVRARLERAFPSARISNCYGATECLVLARQCPRGTHLHVNSDWVVIEPVDADDRPVSYGERSHHVLVTNLANRVFPIIRYRIDDVVIPLEPRTCECGSNLPGIRIEGRTDDTLRLPDGNGGWIALRPLSLGSAITRLPEVEQFQIIQEEASLLRFRYRGRESTDSERIEQALTSVVRDLVTGAGGRLLPDLSFERVEQIERDPVSGKIRRIHSRFAAGGTGAGR